MPQSHLASSRGPAENLAWAHQTYGELVKQNALQGYVSGAEESLDAIIEAAKSHKDWELFFDAQWHLVHILSIENCTRSMYRAAERGLEQAKALGNTNWQCRFQAWINDARQRERQTQDFWRGIFLMLLLLAMVVLGFEIWWVTRVILYPRP
jgi:hypothetical protein